MPLPRAGRPTARAVESVKASAPLQTAARRPLVVVVVVVVVRRQLRITSGRLPQNLGKYYLHTYLLRESERCGARVTVSFPPVWTHVVVASSCPVLITTQVLNTGF